jgi:nucleoid DNA-binding protein
LTFGLWEIQPPVDMSLTKRDLVTRISLETGLVQQQVLDVVQKTLDYIAQSVAKGQKVELRNFGVFEVKIRKARVGRNPNSPEKDVPIPQRAVVKFKPGKEMRDEVIKLTPEQVAAANREDAASGGEAESESQPG